MDLNKVKKTGGATETVVKILLAGSFLVLAAGLMNDMINLEQIGIITLIAAVAVVSSIKIFKLRGATGGVENLKIPGKKKMMLGIIAMVLGIILVGEFFAMLLTSLKKGKMNIKQASIPMGKSAAIAKRLVVGGLLFALVLFYYNLDYYLKTPNSMWTIVASFLFAILMVMILAIVILKEYALLKYFAV